MKSIEGRSTNKWYIKSIRYYFLCNLKFFTSNPNSQVMTTWIIRMNREISIEFSNQSGRGGTKLEHKDNQFLDCRLTAWKGRSTNMRDIKSIRYYFLSNLKFFTSNPSSQVMTTWIIRMNREIHIEFSNQSNKGTNKIRTQRQPIPRL